MNGHVPDGSLAGEVTAHTFLGPVTRVRVAVDGGPELVATVSSTTAPSSHPAPCLGRVPYLAELDGPGVPTLRSRIQAA